MRQPDFLRQLRINPGFIGVYLSGSGSGGFLLDNCHKYSLRNVGGIFEGNLQRWGLITLSTLTFLGSGPTSVRPDPTLRVNIGNNMNGIKSLVLC